MDRVPPQNVEVEQSLLGCMLVDKDAIIAVSGWLAPDHFYDDRHVQIYSNILDLFNEGLPVDLITLTDKLKKQKKLSAVGGRTYIADLATMVATSAHAEEYGQIIKESATRRALSLQQGILQRWLTRRMLA